MRRSMLLWISLLLVAVVYSPASAKEKGKIITAGDFFPDFSFPLTLPRGEMEYLGLPTKFLGLMKGDTFTLKEIKADLVPQVDSISSATMTAALIVDSGNKAKSLYEGLKEKGYIK